MDEYSLVNDLRKQAYVFAAIAVISVIAAFFMVNVELPPGSHYVSAFNVLLFAAPAFWATTYWIGTRAAIGLFAVLGIYALVIETVAIITGFPYGHFDYSEHLGFKLFGYVPWTVAFAWTPLAIGAWAVAAQFASNVLVRIAVGTLLLTLFDLVLDPGAVYINFWQYPEGGVFYGVPMSNFAGWLLTGAIGLALIEGFGSIVRPLLPVPVQLTSSALAIVLFWTMIALFGGLWIAACIGVAIVVALVLIYRTNFYAFNDIVVYVDNDDRPIGTERKLAAHHSETALHRAFSIFLFNEQGELLLQQRAHSKKTWPGVWSNSCCGHPMLHESTESAVRRRVKDELGMKSLRIVLALPDFRYRAELNGIVENEICPVYVGVVDGDLAPAPDEVAETTWVKWDVFLAMVRDPASGISPWAVLEAEELERGGLLRAKLQELGIALPSH